MKRAAFALSVVVLLSALVLVWYVQDWVDCNAAGGAYVENGIGYACVQVRP